MKKIVLVGAMVAAVGMAQAAEWRPMGDTAESFWFLDSSSLATVASSRIGWVKIVTHKQAAANDGVRHSMVKYAAHCKTHQLQALIWTEYKEGGSVKYSTQKPLDSREVIPESMGEYIYNIMCGPAASLKQIDRVGDPVDFTDWYFSRNQGQPSTQ